MPHYYGYRINTAQRDYFQKELKEHGRLRQGWGYNLGQDLRNMTVDEGAARNRSILKVKQGDILLVPAICSLDTVTIVRATQDFATGYRFEIDPAVGDFGHIFPAEYVAEFRRRNSHVGKLKASLRTPMRFWNLDGFAKEIEELLAAPREELLEVKNFDDRYEEAEERVFSIFADEFKTKLYDEMYHQFSESEWEFALVHGLCKMYPDYKIERVGGTTEAKHGADIVIKIPSPLMCDEFYYVIAIQIKDYNAFVGHDPIDQILKADSYPDWNNDQNKLLEKWVVLTGCQKQHNTDFSEYAEEKGVKIIWVDELKELLYNIAMKSKW